MSRPESPSYPAPPSPSAARPASRANTSPIVFRFVRQLGAVGVGSRFGGVLGGLLAVLLLAGVVAHAVLDRRLDATDSIRERSTAALVAAERLRAGLARADATAASNVFAWVALAPSNELGPEQRQAYYDRIKAGAYYAGDHSGDTPVRDAETAIGDDAVADTGTAGADAAVNGYSSALRGAVTALLDLREVDPGACDLSRDPRSTHCAMDRIATLIPEYVGLVAESVANTRAENTVGGSYQTLASELMSTSILGQTDLLVTAYGGRVDSDYRRATSGAAEGVLLGMFGAALVALGAAQIQVFRRTHRILNLGLAAATVLVVAAGGAGLVLLHGQQSGLSTAQRAAYRPTTLLAASRALALQARTCEFLSLMSLGNGEKADRCFERAVAAMGYGPDGQPLARSADPTLVMALDELPDSFAAERERLAAGLRGWLRTRAEVTAILHEPPSTPGGTAVNVFDRAVGQTLESASFDQLTSGMDGLLAVGAGRFDRELRRASLDVRMLSGLVVVVTVLAMACAVLGVGARIREYR